MPQRVRKGKPALGDWLGQLRLGLFDGFAVCSWQTCMVGELALGKRSWASNFSKPDCKKMKKVPPAILN